MTIAGHTVKSYDNDIHSIAANLESMMHLVLESIDMVGQMIKSRNQTLIEKISAHDYKINTLDHLVEKKVTAVLALRQPMAVDLRFIISSLKVSANLERSGDQAKSIIKKIARIGEEEFEPSVEKSLLAMIELSKKMVLESVTAFNNHDLELAKQVLLQDDKIDEIYKDLFRIIDHETFSKSEVRNITSILFIAKSFERLADHSTNIAEIAGFVVTGEIK